MRMLRRAGRYDATHVTRASSVAVTANVHGSKVIDSYYQEKR